jgi:hypothetical protein
MIEKFIEIGAIYQFDPAADVGLADEVIEVHVNGQVISISGNWVLVAHACHTSVGTYIVNEKVQRLINLNKCFSVKRLNPVEILKHE